MTPAINLAAMTEAEKDALILSLLDLVPQLEAALARIAVLEARIDELTRPPKTPDNSSTPPSKAAKPERSTQKELRGRPGTARALAENPDRVVDAHLDACPACQADFPAETQTPHNVYDHIELPRLPARTASPAWSCRVTSRAGATCPTSSA